MARSVEARLERSGRPGRVTRARAEELPFADSSFDTVFATMVLCSVGDVGRALAEIQRVLRPGGRFLFLEHVRSDDPRTARRQDRLRGAWSWFACGCRCNQSTIELLEGTFSVEHLERGELPLAPSIVRDGHGRLGSTPGITRSGARRVREHPTIRADRRFGRASSLPSSG